MKRTKKFPKNLKISPFLWIIIIFISGYFFVIGQSYRSLKALAPQKITTFRIYPGVGQPVEKFVDFHGTDVIVEEFFDSIKDFRLYWPSHDRSIDGWFLEVSSGSKTIQMMCYIPSHKNDTVVVHFGSFGKWFTVDYGWFQSKSLFQWYQKYSYLWSNSPEG